MTTTDAALAVPLSAPAKKPRNSRFSSGPCAKYPSFALAALDDAPLGRSHRAAAGKAKLREAIERTKQLLELPDDYRLGIVPASDTGAVEMAMWNLLGARPVEMLAWESFGAGWVTDAIKQLRLEDAMVKTADYGEIVSLPGVDWDSDVVFTWNGTTSGVRVPEGFEIPQDRQGLTICDATSAVFAQRLPWDKLDVTTFSWQKVLGGEAAHGMIILSPRAVQRLETYTPSWPIPKIFRLTKGGELIEGVFEGATINTPSMLVVEDFLRALDWAEGIGLQGLFDRADENAKVVQDFVDRRDWIGNLARDPETRSNTSVCLIFTDPAVSGDAAFAKAVTKRLEDEGVAFDIGSYRDAPPGLRIWCGGTVEAEDLRALMPWIDWAYEQELSTRQTAD